MHRGGVLAGPALTVKTRPGDNLMVHKAIALAIPGDVIVIAAGGDLTNAIIGELMPAQTVKRGLADIVINGAIGAQRFPVFAAGVTHRGPYKDGSGEINVPIALGSMAIEPGDLILGDDGRLCVSLPQLDAVHAAATATAAVELEQMANIQAGTHDSAWVDATLRRLGCEGLG